MPGQNVFEKKQLKYKYKKTPVTRRSSTAICASILIYRRLEI